MPSCCKCRSPRRGEPCGMPRWWYRHPSLAMAVGSSCLRRMSPIVDPRMAGMVAPLHPAITGNDKSRSVDLSERRRRLGCRSFMRWLLKQRGEDETAEQRLRRREWHQALTREGQSMGGVLAMRVALAHPKSVSHLVLTGGLGWHQSHAFP